MAALLLCLGLLLAAVQFIPADSALPCNSPLRRYLPHRFTHCSSCTYEEWSPWKTSIPLQVVAVANHTCDSGEARRYERSRTAVPGSTCVPDPETEYKYECVPTLRQKAVLIIQALRLGADADKLEPDSTRVTIQDADVTSTNKTISFDPRGKRQSSNINYCPTASQQANNRICPNMCPSARGKHSLEEEKVTIIEAPEDQSLDAAVAVEPFSMEAKVKALHKRRRRQTCNKIRYVLFIVDNSGSIGESTFNKVGDLLANISRKLCDRLRVAMMTYSSDINLEFCFKCYTDRRNIFNAIKRVRYRGGLTHTTDATKCACRKLLTPECGLPSDPSTFPTIDIVYLTDGVHNGRCKNNLQNELNCFHTRTNINTYAIAVGNAARESVKAIEHPKEPADIHIFDVDDFHALEELFNEINLVLNEKDSNGKTMYSCFSHDGACP